MSRCFPTIASPCPQLPANPDNQAEVWCQRCRTTVHNLSALTEAAQAQLLARPGPLCVSYRRPRLPLLASAALLLAVQTGHGLAQDSDDGAELEAIEVVGGGLRGPRPYEFESVFLEAQVPAAEPAADHEAEPVQPRDGHSSTTRGR